MHAGADGCDGRGDEGVDHRDRRLPREHAELDGGVAGPQAARAGVGTPAGDRRWGPRLLGSAAEGVP